MSICVGLDFGGSNTRLLAIEDDGRIVHSTSWPNPVGSGFDVLSMGFESARSEFGSNSICNLGVSITGIIREDSSLAASNLVDLNGVALDKIAKMFGVTSRIFENDVRSALRYIARFGPASSLSSCALLSVGTGIGGAIMLDRKIVRGWSNAAGEFGNVVFPGDESDSLATLEYYVSNSLAQADRYEFPPTDPRRRRSGIAYTSPEFHKLLASLVLSARAMLDPQQIFVMSTGGLLSVDADAQLQNYCLNVVGSELGEYVGPVILGSSGNFCAAGAATRQLEARFGLESI